MNMNRMDKKQMLPPTNPPRPIVDLTDLLGPFRRPQEQGAPMAPDVETVFHPKLTARSSRSRRV